MKVYLELDHGADKNALLKKISKFKDSSKTYDAGNNLIVQLTSPLRDTDRKISRNIERKYKLPGVKTVTIGPVHGSDVDIVDKIRHKNLHCFFDIDSTLTTGNSVIRKSIRNVFEKMSNKHNMRVYFATGRSVPQILKDMAEFSTEPYGIAENGGVLIGLGSKGELLFGDRKEPDILDEYLKAKCPNMMEDIKQAFRKTERIYLQTPKVTKKKLDGYVRKSKAKVDIHASKNSYHVSKKNVNKGTAMDKLTSEMRFGPNDMTVAIGDACMDIPMIKNADVGFAVGNASPDTIKAADISLTRESDKGILEMYEKLVELI